MCVTRPREITPKQRLRSNSTLQLHAQQYCHIHMIERLTLDFGQTWWWVWWEQVMGVVYERACVVHGKKHSEQQTHCIYSAGWLHSACISMDLTALRWKLQTRVFVRGEDWAREELIIIGAPWTRALKWMNEYHLKKQNKKEQTNYKSKKEK